jgi:mono/diheme cytochrome c family protein
MMKGLFPSAAIASSILMILIASEITQTAEPKPPRQTPKLVAQEKQIYAQQCAACHGEEGRGDGPAAYLLYPKPRNFVAANYRLVSTWERMPTDQDLFNTITRGMPGSAMPSWGHLPEEQRWALVYYVKSIDLPPPRVPAHHGHARSELWL